MNPLQTIDLAALHRIDLATSVRHDWTTPPAERPSRRLATILRRLVAPTLRRGALGGSVRG